MKKTIKAFTLIELLVVITIIALLVSILMPSLNKAKQQATMAVCLSSQKQLMTAYIMYADSNNDSMVRPKTSVGKVGDWVSDPIRANGSIVGDVTKTTMEEERRGVEAGALFKYYKDADLVHCPGDKRSMAEPMWTGGTGNGGWRSYSIVGTLNNRDGNNNPDNPLNRQDLATYSNAKVVKKLSRIKMPQEKYVFIEEGDHRGFNMDEWKIDFAQKNYNQMTDSIGIYHNKKGTFGFADGHAAVHDWQVKETIEWFDIYLKQKHGNSSPDWPGRPGAPACPSPNEDIKWLIDHAPKG